MSNASRLTKSSFRHGAILLRPDPLNAIAALKEVLVLDPTAAAAHVELGNLYLEGRNLRDAEYHARQAVALDPEDAMTHWLLGRVLFSQSVGAVFDREKAREAVTPLKPLPNWMRLISMCTGCLGGSTAI